MQKTKSSFLYLSVFGLLLTALSYSVLALDPSLIKPNLNIKVPLLWSVRCTNVEQKVAERIANIEKNRDKHYEKYTTLKERLGTKLDNWKAAGYDVSKIEEDLSTLEDKVSKYKTDYDAYLTKLNTVQDDICGHTENDHINTMKEAKNALKIVRQDVVDIKTFYWTTIRKDILALKNQHISTEEE
jgi:predicted nuclease with TOPRIM domain